MKTRLEIFKMVFDSHGSFFREPETDVGGHIKELIKDLSDEEKMMAVESTCYLHEFAGEASGCGVEHDSFVEVAADKGKKRDKMIDCFDSGVAPRGAVMMMFNV